MSSFNRKIEHERSILLWLYLMLCYQHWKKYGKLNINIQNSYSLNIDKTRYNRKERNKMEGLSYLFGVER